MKNWFVYACDGFRITYVAPNPDNEQGVPFVSHLGHAERFTQDEAIKQLNELPNLIGTGAYGMARFKL